MKVQWQHLVLSPAKGSRRLISTPPPPPPPPLKSGPAGRIHIRLVGAFACREHFPQAGQIAIIIICIIIMALGKATEGKDRGPVCGLITTNLTLIMKVGKHRARAVL